MMQERLSGYARFGLVGATAFAVDSGLLMLMAGAGTGYYVGRAVSLSASVILTFFLYRSFTFRARHPPTGREFLSYLRAVLTGAILNYLIYLLGLQADLHPIFALALATMITMVFNYLRFRRVFSGDG